MHEFHGLLLLHAVDHKESQYGIIFFLRWNALVRSGYKLNLINIFSPYFFSGKLQHFNGGINVVHVERRIYTQQVRQQGSRSFAH